MEVVWQSWNRMPLFSFSFLTNSSGPGITFPEFRNLTTLSLLPLVNNCFSLSSFFQSLLSFLWIGAQFPQVKFLSYGRILTLHYYFLLMCFLFSLGFLVFHLLYLPTHSSYFLKLFCRFLLSFSISLSSLSNSPLVPLFLILLIIVCCIALIPLRISGFYFSKLFLQESIRHFSFLGF